MNNEIKEILKYLKIMSSENEPDIEITREETKLLLDYITNLQTIEQQYSALLSENAELKEVNNYSKRELYKINKDRLEANLKLVEENERLKNRNEFLEKVCVGFDDKYEDYKSRCEKLREYINTHKVSDTISFPLMKKDQENQVKSCFDYEFKQIYKKDLENILNGDDKDV